MGLHTPEFPHRLPRCAGGDDATAYYGHGRHDALNGSCFHMSDFDCGETCLQLFSPERPPKVSGNLSRCGPSARCVILSRVKAESKNPVEVTEKIARRDSSTIARDNEGAIRPVLSSRRRREFVGNADLRADRPRRDQCAVRCDRIRPEFPANA